MQTYENYGAPSLGSGNWRSTRDAALRACA